MRIGASTGCFYPKSTEKSLIQIGELGVKTTEIFPNAFSELQPEFLKEINQIKDHYGIDIVSFHPFMSFAEGFFIFTEYERRYKDSLEMYKPFFNATAQIGAKFFVLHGAKQPCLISDEVYIERYREFSEVAKTFGVQVAHENVVLFKGESIEFLKKIKADLGADFKMVLDTKQARRTKIDVYDFVDEFSENIAHIHISDYSKTSLCTAASEKGLFDFEKFFTTMKNKGYAGKYILELYRHSFDKDIEITKSVQYLSDILNKIG